MDNDLYKTVSYTTELFRLKEPVRITAPSDVTPEIITMMFGDRLYSHEEMHAMYFDHSRNLCFTEKLGMGTLNACVVNEASLWTTMYQQRVNNVILIHNHPSGTEKFSEADKRLAQKLSRSSLTLGVDLTDFLIVTPDYHIYSAKNKGLL